MRLERQGKAATASTILKMVPTRSRSFGPAFLPEPPYPARLSSPLPPQSLRTNSDTSSTNSGITTRISQGRLCRFRRKTPRGPTQRKCEPGQSARGFCKLAAGADHGIASRRSKEILLMAIVADSGWIPMDPQGSSRESVLRSRAVILRGCREKTLANQALQRTALTRRR